MKVRYCETSLQNINRCGVSYADWYNKRFCDTDPMEKFCLNIVDTAEGYSCPTCGQNISFKSLRRKKMETTATVVVMDSKECTYKWCYNCGEYELAYETANHKWTCTKCNKLTNDGHFYIHKKSQLRKKHKVGLLVT